MRHPLDWLLRIGRSADDYAAISGDLEQALDTHDPQHPSRLRRHTWYSGQVLSALWFVLRDRLPRLTRGHFRMHLTADLKFGLRRWRRRPTFAVTAILTLALGVGAATAIFSIVDAVLLRPLPWTKPESLVIVQGVYPEKRSNPATAATWNRGALSLNVWDALRATPVFEHVSAWRPYVQPDGLLGDDRTRLLVHFDVSSNFFSTLGVPMAVGRAFTDHEDNVPSDSLIISHRVWQDRFGGRTDVIGERVKYDRARSNSAQTKTIVGVVAAGFEWQGVAPDVMMPVGISAAVNRQYPSATLRLLARLAPAASLEAADSLAASTAAATHTLEPTSARLVPLVEEYLGGSARSLWLLFGGAGLLLLVACANVAGLLLGEARVRRHEIAVRGALGGSRGRLVRQLLVEYTLMAACGAALGLAFAYWMLGAIVAIAPEGLPRLNTVAIDLRVIGFAFGAGLLTLLTFGIAPAFSLAHTPVARVLAEGGRDGVVTRLLGQRAVVVAEIALALVLLTGAQLFAETVVRLTAQPLGFTSDGLAVLATTFTGSPTGDPVQLRAALGPLLGPGQAYRGREIYERLLLDTATMRTDRVVERIAAVPGVTTVAGASAMPFFGNPSRIPVVLDQQPNTERHDALQHGVTGDYFDVMGMRLLDGRTFTPADLRFVDPRTSEVPAVVSAEFQKQFFPDGAIDRRFRHVYGGSYELSAHYRVVGVVGDVKRQDFADDVRPTFYVSYRQGSGASHFLVRSDADVMALMPRIRQAIADVTPELVVTAAVSMEDRVALSVTEERFRATLSTLFGAAALVLAAVGLYGLVTRRAADRRREFAVRVSLGARPADVRRLVFRDATLVIAVGVLIGLPSAYAAAQVTRTLLFGVTPSSPHVFAMVAGLLGVVTLLATVLPAHRAGRADPIVALKE
jgi:putative ABC transport system permease protein